MFRWTGSSPRTLKHVAATSERSVYEGCHCSRELIVLSLAERRLTSLASTGPPPRDTQRGVIGSHDWSWRVATLPADSTPRVCLFAAGPRVLLQGRVWEGPQSVNDLVFEKGVESLRHHPALERSLGGVRFGQGPLTLRQDE